MKLTVDGGRLTRPSIVAALLLSVACRTARLPDEAPLPPLHAATAEEALTTLRDRTAKLVDVHALIRVRISTPERVESFKATVTVRKPRQMELTVFTPLNTTAATITSDGTSVTIRDAIHGTTEKVTTEDLARTYGVFLPNVAPSDVALLLLGFPSIADATYEATTTGLRRAVVGDTTVDYESPAVRVTRPGETVEITVLDVVGRMD